MPDVNNNLVGTKIKATPVPEKNIGVDTKDTLVTNIVNSAINSQLDLSALQNFSSVSQSREQIYSLIDSMAQDSTVASILETYAEDCVETNDKGQIVWCESGDEKVGKYVNYLLETMNTDKHIYNWAYSLVKYGDFYLRLYRESDYEQDEIFSVNEANARQHLNEKVAGLSDVDDEPILLSEALKEEQKAEKLEENVNVNINHKNDRFTGYVEMVSNPGEMFELTRFGKTMGYIKAPVNIQNSHISNINNQNYYRYNLKQKDVEVFGALSFVHASLDDNSSRTPEEVTIFRDEDSTNSKSEGITYKVKRGQSLLYNVFKIWRELSLLENSVLLNRITKSSILRVIAVEVGDMPKENVASHLQGIKQLIEQKSAINTGKGMEEYTNPGPVENNIYVPTHNGVGNLTTQQIGGDVDPKQLTDLSYFQDKFFGSMRVPKQYFGVTDDAAGFNGGSSLSIISSRYGKAVKRIQNTILQALTDAIHLMLLDRHLDSYIGKFTLRMQAPITQEEIDKRDNLSNKIRVVGDIINTLGDIQDPIIKLKVIKSLISTVVSDSEVIGLIQEQIDKLNEEAQSVEPNPDSDSNDSAMTDERAKKKEANQLEFEKSLFGDDVDDTDNTSIQPEETNSGEEVISNISSESGDQESYLPSPAELDLDLTQNN